MREFYWKVRGLLLKIVLFLSPTIAIAYSTAKATSEDEYRDNPITLQDPGHKLIRQYDRLVLLTSYAITIVILLLNVDTLNASAWLTTDLSLLSEEALKFKVIMLLFCPQITGGWLTFLLWSGFFAFLRFYDSRRSKIIRDTNERLGVW